jgi:V/A-type H+-transporting ATPase subunit E
MKGIEKITARIAQDAETEVSAIRGESDQAVAKIRAEYDQKAQDAYAAILREGEKENEQRASRIDRTAQLDAKRAVLAMKQDLVSQAFAMAEKKIAQMSEADYVSFLVRQVGKAASTGKEEIILNAEDRTKCGAKLVEQANQVLGAKGALTLSAETRPMIGGFILKQGDIEVNCTVDMMLELSRGTLAAQVAEVLFEG